MNLGSIFYDADLIFNDLEWLYADVARFDLILGMPNSFNSVHKWTSFDDFEFSDLEIMCGCRQIPELVLCLMLVS